MPRFSVDIQATTEHTYHVEAATDEEAEEIAMAMYLNAETPEHEDTFDPHVTNCEKV